MARALATYIDCPHEIRRRVLDNFRSSPNIHEIRKLRIRHLRPPPPIPPCKPHDGYYPNEAAASLAKTNLAFLARLEAERAISNVGRRTLASEPDYANLRWNADILTAGLGEVS
jgi:hypothetical protein